MAAALTGADGRRRSSCSTPWYQQRFPDDDRVPHRRSPRRDAVCRALEAQASMRHVALARGDRDLEELATGRPDDADHPESPRRGRSARPEIDDLVGQLARMFVAEEWVGVGSSMQPAHRPARPRRARIRRASPRTAAGTWLVDRDSSRHAVRNGAGLAILPRADRPMRCTRSSRPISRADGPGFREVDDLARHAPSAVGYRRRVDSAGPPVHEPATAADTRSADQPSRARFASRSPRLGPAGVVTRADLVEPVSTDHWLGASPDTGLAWLAGVVARPV